MISGKSAKKSLLSSVISIRKSYGYGAAGSYGLELDEEGTSLFFYVTGGFRTRESGFKFRRPAMFLLHIPETERME